MTSPLTNGALATTSAGDSSSASMPQVRAEVMRRRSSSMRSSVRATSMPPQVVFTPRAAYCRWLSRVSIAISRLWSVGKMKFEAWPVEPPGLGSGPLSMSTRSRQPSSARCATRQLPTMPAPMTAMDARDGGAGDAPATVLVVDGFILGLPVARAGRGRAASRPKG